MTEHVHEWEFMADEVYAEYGAYCSEGDCKEKITSQEVIRRLNATERLSTREALVAEAYMHTHLDDNRPFIQVQAALRAYAHELEGTDANSTD